jgi:asparagine synthase (glutamine-hydrolysing)
MLQAEVRFEDIGAPVGMTGGGIFFGKSWVLPYAHRLLRTSVIDGPDRLVVGIAERFADDDEGIDFRASTDDRQGDALSRRHARHLLDWSVLTIDKRRRTVSYRASQWNSAPVWLRDDGAAVRIDWDYARLLDGTAVEIDWPMLLSRIAGTSPYAPRTMIAGLYRATANAALMAHGGRVSIRLPRPVSYAGPQELIAGTDPEAALVDALVALLEARPLAVSRTAVEVSGGMDSALTAMATARALGPGIMSVGAQFDGTMGAAQRARRRMLCERGEFDDLEVPAMRFAPFGPASHRRRSFGVWPEDENYPELFETVFGTLADAGIDTLITGLGGDELYVAYEGEEEAHLPLSLSGSHYLTAEGKRLAGTVVPPYPPGRLQESCWKAAAGRAQRLLRHGLWPVYPYHSADLAAFVGSLPVEYRRDRRLLRRALTRVTGDAVFETDYVKEGFRDVAVRGITDNRDWLIATAERSGLLQSRLLDGAYIRKQLAAEPAGLADRDFNYLYFFLTICCFFQPPDD